ncbi:hypothetical protein K431DRAFT_284528 [Polychaeton citri CBS 116435]|uniref:MFS general substrate transporter n=1 Tax=Polychaeton citri CBS 116435 TaxID=1314669 RepID=A0A9P4Q747_9PEZI|nr:hypothetical protein K431DRAFT_284528 [Polychaeton citri CBS 116435]
MPRFFPALTATRLQASAYLFGIALFSIAFLVFLNASISFVVTYVIGQHHNVGDTVGTLGFADELLALVACPMWGLLSDRVGVRTVATMGYCVVGFSLVCLVQSQRVYPDLLLARLGFSIGGAACSTMVTAVLPAMVTERKRSKEASDEDSVEAGSEGAISSRERWRPGHSRDSSGTGHTHTPSVCSELTITPQRYTSLGSDMRRTLFRREGEEQKKSGIGGGSDTSRLAGLVGMFTGLGALVALVVFLPLPAYLHENGEGWAKSVRSSFYIVASFAFTVAVFVFFGLRNLPGEENKSLSNLFRLPSNQSHKSDQEAGLGRAAANTQAAAAPSYTTLILESLKLGFTDPSISLGYLGGFVARASSVGVSLFIPLFVNAYFIRTGLCSPMEDDVNNPSGIKDNCKDAYKVAQALAGIAETAALICAPIFGWIGSGEKSVIWRKEWPLLTATIAGVIGYTLFGLMKNPDAFHGTGGSRWAFLAVVLIGVSQIGAIVCSLGLLARGIHGSEHVIELSTSKGISQPTAQQQEDHHTEANSAAHNNESAPLLNGTSTTSDSPTLASHTILRTQLKGSIAGIYSFAGGAGILLLTKLGGFLFDAWSPGAPFFMLAIANAALFVAVVVIGGARVILSRMLSKDRVEEDERQTAEPADSQVVFQT